MSGGNKGDQLQVKIKGNILSHLVYATAGAMAAIQRGTMVNINAGGFAIQASDTASEIFAGISEEAIAAKAAGMTQGDKSVRVRRKGIFKMKLDATSGAANAPTLKGDLVYVHTAQGVAGGADELVGLAANVSQHVLVGKIVKHGTDADAIANTASTEVWVDILGVSNTAYSATFVDITTLAGHGTGDGADDVGVEDGTGFGDDQTVQDALEAILDYQSEPIPLSMLQETDGTNIVTLVGVGTTPKLDMASGDTDSGLVLEWVTGNVDAVLFQIPLPELNTDVAVAIKFRAKCAVDTPVISADSYFDEGDSKIEDDSAALGAAYAENTITIAAGDIPAGAQTLTVELTPGTHAGGALVMSALWVNYAKKFA